MSIHPTSVVHPNAEIDPSVQVGPFCSIGPHVRIAAGTRLISHAVVCNHTTLGARNLIHPFACLGGVPQDLKYRGEAARLVVGDDNVFREGVTCNIGTAQGGMQTRIGHGCLFMAYAHVAHDCALGDGVIVANGVGLAGHVDVGPGAILGGLAGIHQYCRIGRLAFVGAGAMVAQDVPPFVVVQGDRASIAGINGVGLRRAGFGRSRVLALRRGLYRLLGSTGGRHMAWAELQHALGATAQAAADLRELYTFVQAAAGRGICPLRTTAAATVDASDA